MEVCRFSLESILILWNSNTARTTGCPFAVCPIPTPDCLRPIISRHAVTRFLSPWPFVWVCCGDVTQTSFTIQTIRQMVNFRWNLVPSVWGTALLLQLATQTVCANTRGEAACRPRLLISVWGILGAGPAGQEFRHCCWRWLCRILLYLIRFQGLTFLSGLLKENKMHAVLSAFYLFIYLFVYLFYFEVMLYFQTNVN